MGRSGEARVRSTDAHPKGNALLLVVRAHTPAACLSGEGPDHQSGDAGSSPAAAAMIFWRMYALERKTIRRRMDDMDTFCEGEEQEGDEGRDRQREADPALSNDGLHGAPDAGRDLLPVVHSLRDVSEGGTAGLLPVPSGSIPVAALDEQSTPALREEPGREFVIGRKIFTLQRSLCDNTWDVDIPSHGWVSTGYPANYTAGMAEARFRNDFKGGAKKWIDRRIRDTNGE